MGLRERALDYTQEQSKSPESLNLALTPRDVTLAGLREKALEKLDLPEAETLSEPAEYRAEPARFLSDHSLQTDDRQNQDNSLLEEKLSALQDLLDLTREALKLKSNQNLFDLTLLAILAHTGVRKGAIYLFTEKAVETAACRGIELPRDLQLNSVNWWLNLFQNANDILYAKKLKSEYPEIEPLCNLFEAELIVPLKDADLLTGFLILEAPALQHDFSLGDLFYIQQAASLTAVLREMAGIQKDYEKASRVWQHRDKKQKAFNEFQTGIARLNNDEDRCSYLRDSLVNEFKLSTFLLLTREDFLLKPRLSHGLSKYGEASFETPLNDSWLKSITGTTGFHELTSWKDDRNLINRMNPEDINVIKKVMALPLYHDDHLAGLFLLFQVSAKLQHDDQYLIQGLLQTYIWSELVSESAKRNTHLQSMSLNDPFHHLKNIIQNLENELSEKNHPYSTLLFKIDNLARIKNILGVESANTARNLILQVLKKDVPANAHFSELAPGRFFVILPNSDKAAIWTLTKKLHKEIVAEFPREELRPVLQNKMITRPENPFSDLETFLFET